MGKGWVMVQSKISTAFYGGSRAVLPGFLLSLLVGPDISRPGDL